MSAFEGMAEGWDGLGLILEKLGDLDTHYAVFAGPADARHATCPMGCGRVRVTSQRGVSGPGVSGALERLDGLAASRGRRAVHLVGYGGRGVE